MLDSALFYLYDETLLGQIPSEDAQDFLFITAKDFEENSEVLSDFFKKKHNASLHLTKKETEEIKKALNPNTNLNPYTAKPLPKEYEPFVVSRSGAKQKFKGPRGSGKTLLLVKRVINCANRLNKSGRILVVSGDAKKAADLKEFITAEDGRSLQELGIDVSSYQELVPPTQKYRALFIDDGHCLTLEEFDCLLEKYLETMTEENEYEYVVMADEDCLPTVPKIFGPFRQLQPIEG